MSQAGSNNPFEEVAIPRNLELVYERRLPRQITYTKSHDSKRNLAFVARQSHSQTNNRNGRHHMIA
jgi:hypothetical protein